MPDTIKKKDLLKDITTRKQLREELQKLQTFSKRGAEKIQVTKGGALIPTYELEELKRERRKQLLKLNKEIKELGETKIKVAGIEQDVTFKEGADKNYVNKLERYKLLKKRELMSMTPAQLESYKNLLERTKYYKSYYDRQFMKNYMTGLEEIGRFYNIPKNKINTIKEKLLNLDKEEFLKIFDTDKAIQEIMEHYKDTSKFGNTKRSKAAKKLYSDLSEDVLNLFETLEQNIDLIVGE